LYAFVHKGIETVSSSVGAVSTSVAKPSIFRSVEALAVSDRLSSTPLEEFETPSSGYADQRPVVCQSLNSALHFTLHRPRPTWRRATQPSM